NSRGDPPGTCRTSAGTLYPGRPALDRSHHPGVPWSAGRASPNRFPLGAPHVSSPFPTCLASPFLSHRNDITPFIPRPGGTDCDRHDSWQNLPSRGASADCSEDRWGAPLCRGSGESPPRIGVSTGGRGTVRTGRGAAVVRDSCDVARLPYGAPGPAGECTKY